MNTTEQQLKRINEKLQTLIKEYGALQKDNARLKQELLLAQDLIGQQQKNSDVLKQQVSVLKLGSAEMNGEDKKEFEKRINGYIKEIDRCIVLLGE